MPMDHDPDLGLYAISVAAELTGAAPQTLRLYETKGLLEPARSDGGTRRYSRRDLDRVEQIMSMTAEGLTLEGIRRIIAMQTENDALRAEIQRLRGELHQNVRRPSRR